MALKNRWANEDHRIATDDSKRNGLARRTSLHRQALVVLAITLSLCGMACASTDGMVGNSISRTRDCDQFEGVFRSVGRWTPDHEIGATVAEEHGRINTMYLGRHVLNCSADDDASESVDCPEGDADHSYAMRYRSGTLHWAALDRSTGQIAARGQTAMDCRAGQLIRRESWSVREYPMFAGREKAIHVLLINEDGWLVRYRKVKSKGVLLVLIPYIGSNSGSWAEFPPVPDQEFDLDSLFD